MSVMHRDHNIGQTDVKPLVLECNDFRRSVPRVDAPDTVIPILVPEPRS